MLRLDDNSVFIIAMVGDYTELGQTISEQVALIIIDQRNTP
jgi:hypothetical protein